MRLRLIQRLKKTKVYQPGGYKGLPKGVNWQQTENRTKREGRGILKGVNKRVIVVNSPDPRIFEQAIFIIREDVLMGKNGRNCDILREAQEVADRYIRTAVLPPRQPPRRVSPAVLALGGAVLAGIVWLALHLAHVI